MAYNSCIVDKTTKNVNVTDTKLRDELKNNGYNNASVNKSGNKFKVTFESWNIYTITDDGTIQKYEKVEPTAIYAKLYTDGTLILSSTDYTDETLGEYTDYGDVSKKVNYNEEGSPPYLKGECPGWMDGIATYYPGANSKIKKVIIKDKIAPTNTSYWFVGCSQLTDIQGIENLYTSNVTDMKYMFRYCQNLNSLNLNNFDTSNVTDMSDMFDLCSKWIDLDVSSFDTSNVTDMSGMFTNSYNRTEIKGLDNFDTSNVTNMRSMFQGGYTSLNLSSFNTEKVTDMSNMFCSCRELKTLDLSNFNTKNVTNMRGMFSSCENLTNVNLSSFDTSKVTNMLSMFGNCTSLYYLDVSNFDTNAVTNWNQMFSYVTARVFIGAKWNPSIDESTTWYRGTSFEVKTN